MNIEEFRNHCLAVKTCGESFPFIDPNVLVFKVMDKIFAYTDIAPKNGEYAAYMKCDPERSIELREKYAGIRGDRFQTLLWNWVALDGDVPDDLIVELLHHSVDEVIKKLPKKRQQEYREMEG